MKEVDKQTIIEFGRGDHRAFEQIFDAFYGRVKAFIHGYVKSAADAEELAEDVFVRLWEGRTLIDPARSLNSFLHTMARNAALNHLRRKFVREGYLPDDDVSATSEEEVIAQETALLIEMAVEKMPPQRREIYRMSRGEGLRNDEIATRLGTTKRNVESQLSTALHEIKRVVLSLPLFF